MSDLARLPERPCQIGHGDRLVALILLVARSTVGASLTVAWDPVASFVVYYGTSFGVYTASVDAGNATQKQIDSFANGTRATPPAISSIYLSCPGFRNFLQGL